MSDEFDDLKSLEELEEIEVIIETALIATKEALETLKNILKNGESILSETHANLSEKLEKIKKIQLESEMSSQINRTKMGAFILKAMKDNRISLKKLAQISGVPQETIKDILQGKVDITRVLDIDKMSKIATALEIGLPTLLHYKKSR